MGEAIGVPLLYASLRLVKLYRPSFHQTSPWLYRLADRLGVFPVIDHYHDPMVSLATYDRRRGEQGRPLGGVNLRQFAQLSTLAEFSYGDELLAFLRPAASELDPTYDNLAFGPGDAEILYSFVRHFRPRLVAEVGAGHSTRFIAAALDANGANGDRGDHVCIEPFESPWLADMPVTLIRETVESTAPEVFDRLGQNDILFIDSSHVARPQGDVLFLLHQVLPRLQPGVLIHIHDIFTPRDYPYEWLERRWFWDEQYVVEALLAYNDRYQVELAMNWLFHDHQRELFRACPVLAKDHSKPPASLWLRVRGPEAQS